MRFQTCLATAAALATVFTASSAFAGDGQNLVQYLPSGAVAVVNVDVAALRATSAFDTLWGLLEGSDEFGEAQEYMTSVGFDPRADLSTIMIVSTDLEDEDDMAIIIEGNFDRAAVETQIAAVEAATATTAGTATFYTHTNGSSTGFVADNVMVFGNTDVVTPACSVSGGAPTGAGASNTLGGQIGDADHSDTIWIAGIVPRDIRARTEFSGMESFNASIDLSSGLGLSLSFDTDSDASATARANDFNTQITAVQASPEVQALGFGSVLQSVSAAADGDDVDISVAIDAGTWTTLMTTLAAIASEELN